MNTALEELCPKLLAPFLSQVEVEAFLLIRLDGAREVIHKVYVYRHLFLELVIVDGTRACTRLILAMESQYCYSITNSILYDSWGLDSGAVF